MTVKQISVFMENKPGKLAEFAKLLHKHGIDMRAMSIAEAPDFGILRVIVNDSYTTACLLKDEGYVCSVTPVLAVAIPDEPGSLVSILTVLNENDINIDYSYAFTARTEGLAYMILRVTDNDKAISVLGKNGVKLISQDQLSDL